jgi:hypothetical protein
MVILKTKFSLTFYCVYLYELEHKLCKLINALFVKKHTHFKNKILQIYC